MKPFPCHAISDRALEANASILAVAVLSHPVALQLGGETVTKLAEISERSPPHLSVEECAFLRQAIAAADAAEIAANRDDT